MNIKNALITILFSVSIIACDKIDGPYGNGNSGPVDTIEQDTVLRKILIEDFTGHTCQACPNAHREATRLHGLFGDRIIVMALHADFWADPYPPTAPYYTYDFRTPLATQIATDFNVIGQPFPKGMVNRMLNPATNATWIMDWGSWEDRVIDWLALPADAGIEMSATYDTVSRAISTQVKIKVLNDLGAESQIAVYLIEDGIIKWQKDQTASPADVPNYEHNHVLRSSLNGAYGENLGILTAGTEINRSYNGILTPADAVPGNVKLVAILSNVTTREVIQVEEIALP